MEELTLVYGSSRYPSMNLKLLANTKTRNPVTIMTPPFCVGCHADVRHRVPRQILCAYSGLYTVSANRVEWASGSNRTNNFAPIYSNGAARERKKKEPRRKRPNGIVLDEKKVIVNKGLKCIEMDDRTAVDNPWRFTATISRERNRVIHHRWLYKTASRMHV